MGASASGQLGLAALVEMAKTKVSQRAEQQRAVADAIDNIERSQAAHSQWQAAIHVAFPETAGLRDALPTLQNMRKVYQRLEAAQRQIDGMVRDQASFERYHDVNPCSLLIAKL